MDHHQNELLILVPTGRFPGSAQWNEDQLIDIIDVLTKSSSTFGDELKNALLYKRKGF